MKKYIILALAFIYAFNIYSQSRTELAGYFEEAYQRFPNIPRGLLEAVAYTNTRMQHLRPDGEDVSCMGIPEYFGVMGLIEDGKGYFENTLQKVSRLSGFTIAEIKQNPRTNIMAYATAYDAVMRSQVNTFALRSADEQQPVVSELSEIPRDESEHNKFALDQQFYQILKQMERPGRMGIIRSTGKRFDYEKVFGKDRVELLTAPALSVRVNRNALAVPRDANESNSTNISCTRALGQAEFPNAVWASANSRNFGSRNGDDVKYITIHTVQGSYASAISWFKNPNARVSTHYVVRSSDGQVTQMVCENDKAFHVRESNGESIGIEHEGFIDDGGAWYTEEMYQSSAALVRDIAQRHGINLLQTYGGPPSSGLKVLSNTCYRVKGHQHFVGNNHIDPGPSWDWDRYYRLVNGTPKPQEFKAVEGKVSELDYRALNRKTYLIDPPGDNPVSISFDLFDVEGDENTPFDYLLVFDGKDQNGRLLGRFSGNKNPGTLIGNSGSLFLEFRSDCQANGRGWSASYKATNVDMNCPPIRGLISENTFAMGTSLKWDQNNNARNYLIRLKPKNLSNQWESFNSTINSFTATGLTANTLYEWQVQAQCGDRELSGPVGGSFSTPSVSRRGATKVYTVRTEKGAFL